ncbi:MAG: LysR family transcriptional regulator [Lachnospiraceae bacterium]
MEFKQYHYVLKVVELQSITKAANALYISQPSLSHYIAKVENELGAQIFNRTTSPISLTQAGQAYVKTAQEVLNLDRQLQEEISDISSNKKGKIVLGIPSARASFMLPPILKEFWRRYPGIHIETIEENSTHLSEYVLQGKADIAIIPMIMSESVLEVDVIYEEELLLVANDKIMNDIHCMKSGIIDIKQIEELPFILLRKKQGLRRAVDIYFSQLGIKPNIIFETSSNETAYRMAALSMGATIVPQIIEKMSSYEPKPNKYSITSRGLRWYIAAIYRKDDYLGKAKKELIQISKEIFSELDISNKG